MIRTENVSKKMKDFARVKKLYETSFPPEERMPLKYILYGGFSSLDFAAFYDNEIFCGFFMLMTQGDITHILYLAVEEAFRNRGYGAEALKIVREMKPSNRLVVDIETPDAASDNYEQRIRRKAFYLRNGYRESDIAYWWNGVAYEILVRGADVTEEEFEGFWKAARSEQRKA